MIEYTWYIGPLDVKLSENGIANVVYNVNWRLIGKDGHYAASVYGSVPIDSPESESFTPYEQLTKEMVLGWIKEKLGEDQISAYEVLIANQIENQKNPVVASLQPPWSE